MSLKQSITLTWPVHRSDGGAPPKGTSVLVQVGDTVHVVQRDKALTTVVLTGVRDGAKTIEWGITAGQPRSHDIIAVDGQHQFVVTDDDPLHTDPTKFGDLPVVQQTS